MYIVIAIKFISKKNVKSQSSNCAERNKVKKLGQGIKFQKIIFCMPFGGTYIQLSFLALTSLKSVSVSL